MALNGWIKISEDGHVIMAMPRSEMGQGVHTALPMLVAARVGQALGAAGIMSVNTALFRFIFPPSQLGRGISVTTLTVAVCSASGRR